MSDDDPPGDAAELTVVRLEGHDPPFGLRVPAGSRACADGRAGPSPDGHPTLRFAVAAPWPDEQRLRCHPLREWPDDGEVVERVGVTSAVRRGPCLDLVLDRGRRDRCQLIVGPVELDDSGSAATDREGVFWQTAGVATSVAPRQRVPTALERGVGELPVLIDTREQEPWEFADLPVTTGTRTLAAGDDAVDHDDAVVAAVERKKTSDFARGLMRGRLPPQLAALSELPRAAVVIQSSYANVINNRTRITRRRMADLIGSVQAAYPRIPFVFAGSRGSAQEWTYHWLSAALSHHRDELDAGPLDPL